MSLIGSLEDLSLGDILQIISLSQKSGVLILSGDQGEGRIVFRDGLVCAAVVKGGAEDLHGLVVDAGFVSDSDFQHASEEARERGVTVDEILVSKEFLPRERIESICREAIEQAVFAMFNWRTGDFSFDVRTEFDPEDPSYSLSVGINAQYLAMESARHGDETGRDGGEVASPGGDTGDGDSGEEPEMSAHEMFGVAPDPAPALEAVPELEPSEEIELVAVAEPASDFATTEPQFGESEEGVVLDSAHLEEPQLPLADAQEAAEIVAVAATQRASQADETVESSDVAFGDSIADAPVEASFEAGIEAVEFASDAPEAVPPVVHVDDAFSDEGLDEWTEDSLLTPPSLSVESVGLVGSVEPIEPIESVEPVDAVVEQTPTASTTSSSPDASSKPFAASQSSPQPIVIIDPDLPTLEWAKRTLSSRFERVHVFQRSELGLARIRQYLVRMEVPVVLIAPKAPGDRLSGIVDAQDFVRRLKQQSPRMPILWMFDDEHPSPTVQGEGDGTIVRPSESTRSESSSEKKLDALGANFVEKVTGHVSSLAPSAAGASSAASNTSADLEESNFSPEMLSRLKQVTETLAAGASRGEVLPLVIRYASEIFSRAAMFMVQDQSVVGIAQVGLARVGGPDDQGLQGLRIDANDCGWFRTVFATGASVVAPPSDAGDQQLAGLLGDRVASMAYVAPIESEGQIVALLYADNLPSEGAIGDTSGLEVVLHHAGLALERAFLKRALAEMEGDEPGGRRV